MDRQSRTPVAWRFRDPHRPWISRAADLNDLEDPGVLVACPDARMPAYRAVIGLAEAGLLGSFVTAGFDTVPPSWRRWTHAIGPLERRLARRREPRIPRQRVRACWSVDVAQLVENQLSDRRATLRHAIARWRTEHVDRTIAAQLEGDQNNPRFAAALLFSDVGSRFALSACRRVGIPSVLSVVHGDIEEERELLALESQGSARDFFPIYLGDAPMDLEELDWMHARRRVDVQDADRILVPSEHIAERLRSRGTPASKIDVVPYAADTQRFRPRWTSDRATDAAPSYESSSPSSQLCRFLFAGGICQRKGLKYLLQAWQMVKRPGWTLSLLGPAPRGLDALAGPLLADVTLLGRAAHAEMPSRLAEADVFVFPSLFEGSAVVTYEALASGLPLIVTPQAGSVARDGQEGLMVPPRDPEALASAMVQLGEDATLRDRLARAARRRAEQFDWNRYQAAVVANLREAIADGPWRCVGFGPRQPVGFAGGGAA